MRKRIMLYLGVFGMIISFHSCIKEEALNQEADIIEVALQEGILKRDPVIENNKVVCYIKANVDITKMAPTFKLTEGATVYPASSTRLDFTNPQKYTVTSQDGQWSKVYTVSFIYAELATHYHFDYYEEDIMDELNPDHKFHVIYEQADNKKTTIWASANSGYSILAAGKSPYEYPTCIEQNGYSNRAAKMTTCSTGFLGAMFGSPLAAGNLFLGNFQLDITNALKSTHFGMPFERTPISLKGYYKYHSGDIYQRNTDASGNKIDGGEVAEQKDSCAIYAVFYETTKEMKYLDGVNILTHPNIISIALLKDAGEHDDWTAFNVPFIYQEGKAIDSKKLKDGIYNLAIVFSSSKDGAIYNGAIGSTLYVDEVELISEKSISETK